MGCLIECNRTCEGWELHYIREIDERLETGGPNSDTRERLDCARLIVSEMDGDVALTLFGRQGTTEIAMTIRSPHMSIAHDIAVETMCKIFKVVEEKPPF